MTVDAPRPELTDADQAWFGERVDGMLPELYGTACRLCGDQTRAEDLVSDAVTKAWEALPSLQDRGAFPGWIFRILSNTFISQSRTSRAKAEHTPLDTTGDDFSLFERLHQPILLWWGNPEMDFLNRLLREDLERAIDRLPEEFRTAVVMVDVQGMAYREVAELLEIPIGTVRSRLARGRSLLQETLWEHALEAGLREGPPPHDKERDLHDRE